MRFTLKALALAAGLLLPSAAMAVPAVVTTDLNIRSGPGSGYPRIGTIPYNDQVDVDGCLRGFNWCNVYWRGRNGWVSGRYLAYLQGGYARPIPQVGIGIGIPIIRFEIERDRDWRGPPRWRDRRGPPRWRDRDDWGDWRDRDDWRDRRSRRPPWAR